MAPTKVFVGNLAFKTGESELAEAFSAAGNVLSTNIITRGPRSLGYGFVELESEESAKKAVDLLNKKELDGRAINVEVAKPRPEGEQQQGSASSPQAAAPGGAPRGRGGRGRGRGGRGGRGVGGGGRGAGGVRRRAPREEGAEKGEEGGADAAPTAAPRRPRAPRPPRDNSDRKPSTTTLFVANLPFALDDPGFAKVLGDSKVAFKSAHVVAKKNGRSKGFGFIEFDSEKDQQAALAALNGKKIDERDLIVKVALTEGPNGGKEGKAEETGKEGKQEKKEEAKPATPIAIKK